jgi:hypothetical protein
MVQYDWRHQRVAKPGPIRASTVNTEGGVRHAEIAGQLTDVHTAELSLTRDYLGNRGFCNSCLPGHFNLGGAMRLDKVLQ